MPFKWCIYQKFKRYNEKKAICYAGVKIESAKAAAKEPLSDARAVFIPAAATRLMCCRNNVEVKLLAIRT